MNGPNLFELNLLHEPNPSFPTFLFLDGNSFLALLQNPSHECHADRCVELCACNLTGPILCLHETVTLYLTDSFLPYVYSSLFPLSWYGM